MARILVADDDPLLLELTERALARRGHDVHVFADGEAAALALEEAEADYDLAIVDLHMPGCDGLEVLATARRCAPRLPVVMVSCSWQEHDRRAARRGGAFRVLEKPVGIEALYEAVEAATHRRTAPEHDAPPHGDGDRASEAGALDLEVSIVPPPPAPTPPPMPAPRVFVDRSPVGGGIVVGDEAHEPADAPDGEEPETCPAPPQTTERPAATLPPPAPLDEQLSPSMQIEVILERERRAAADLDTPAPVRVALDPPRLLVVERDRSLANLVTYCLRRQGYRVEQAADLRVALRRIEASPPELLVLDVAGQRGPTAELLERLRAAHGNRGPAVIAVYTAAASADAVHALDAGADLALARPYEPELLFAHVRALLRRAGPSHEGAGSERERAAAHSPPAGERRRLARVRRQPRNPL